MNINFPVIRREELSLRNLSSHVDTTCPQCLTGNERLKRKKGNPRYEPMSWSAPRQSIDPENDISIDLDMDLMELSCEYSHEFQALLENREKVARFKDILYDFLQDNFCNIYPTIPTKIEFSLFQDPDLDFPEPRVEIHVPVVKGFSRSMLHERFARGLKEYLASRSKDLAEFTELRELQREFIIVFKLE